MGRFYCIGRFSNDPAASEKQIKEVTQQWKRAVTFEQAWEIRNIKYSVEWRPERVCFVHCWTASLLVPLEHFNLTHEEKSATFI